ncbi:MAG TPA: endonuclease/exonuclease/phosphatase family protein [Kiritimatiellia bacterium]|nr:endonuclease/exonuclease/phosphatase family protein [Kiritimatiellia bacterium]
MPGSGKVRRIWALAALGGLLASGAGCGRGGGSDAAWTLPGPGQHEFSFVSYNVSRFGFFDRDRNGQTDNFKPDEEVAGLMFVLGGLRPDVLAVQELGCDHSVVLFGEHLERAGISYAHHAVIRSAGNRNLGLYSRFPITELHLLTNVNYTIQGQVVPVTRGFIEAVIEPRPGASFRVLIAHLKSRQFSPHGQTEMRRNEARLLARLVRERMAARPGEKLLVAGDFNDVLSSAPLRELLGDGVLEALPLADGVGDGWTHRDAGDGVYTRSSFVLVNREMKGDWVAGSSGVVRHPRGMEGSDHRPLVAVFRVSESQTAGPGAGSSGSGLPGPGR